LSAQSAAESSAISHSTQRFGYRLCGDNALVQSQFQRNTYVLPRQINGLSTLRVVWGYRLIADTGRDVHIQIGDTLFDTLPLGHQPDEIQPSKSGLFLE